MQSAAVVTRSALEVSFKIYAPLYLVSRLTGIVWTLESRASKSKLANQVRLLVLRKRLSGMSLDLRAKFKC